MMSELTTSTFSEVPSTPDGFQKHSDLVQEYVQLTVQFLSRYPVQYLQSPLATAAFRWSLPGAMLFDREASKSVLYYYKTLIRYAVELPHQSSDTSIPSSDSPTVVQNLVRELITQNGYILVRELVVGGIIEGQIAPSRLPRVADVLVLLKTFDQTLLNAWIVGLLQQIQAQSGQHTGFLPPAEGMQKFLEKVVQGVSENEVQLGVDDFYEACRRIRIDHNAV